MMPAILRVPSGEDARLRGKSAVSSYASSPYQLAHRYFGRCHTQSTLHYAERTFIELVRNWDPTIFASTRIVYRFQRYQEDSSFSCKFRHRTDYDFALVRVPPNAKEYGL